MSEIEKRILKLRKEWIFGKGTVPGCLFLGYAEEIALFQSDGFLFRGGMNIIKFQGMEIIRVDAPNCLMVGDVYKEATTNEQSNADR